MGLKYDVGDKVVIGTIEQIDKAVDLSNSPGLDECMYTESGKVAVISSIPSKEKKWYMLEDSEWTWSEEMLNPVLEYTLYTPGMDIKPGMKFKVRTDLIEDKDYGVQKFVLEMVPMLGKIVTIKARNASGKSYKINECGCNWNEKMFETEKSPQTFVKVKGSITLDGLKKAFPLGTKVVPHAKTVPGTSSLGSCPYWSDAKQQGFMYVNGYTTIGFNNTLILGGKCITNHGNYYMPQDVALYSQESKSFNVGDIVELKKGLVIGKVYENFTLLPSMLTSKQLKIIKVSTTCVTLNNHFMYPVSILTKINQNIISKEEETMLNYTSKVSNLLTLLKLGQAMYKKNSDDGWFKFGCVIKRASDNKILVVTGFKADSENLSGLNCVPVVVAGAELVAEEPITFYPASEDYTKVSRYGFEFLNDLINTTKPADPKKEVLAKKIAEVEAKLAEMKKEVSTL